MSNSNNSSFNTAFNKFVQAGAGGSGRNNPDSRNYVAPKKGTLAQNKGVKRGSNAPLGGGANR